MHTENRVRFFESPQYDEYGRRLMFGNSTASLFDPQARLTIPRPGLRQPINPEMELSSTNILVTPDEDALFRVANEFRFLDERPLGLEPEHSTRNGSRDLSALETFPRKPSKKRIAFCLVASLLQLIFAVAVLTCAGLRFRTIFQLSSSLFDFENPLAEVLSNATISSISVLSGSSWFVPALLHTIAAITALWPLVPNFITTLQVLYVIFSSCSIIFWFNALFSTVFELNVYYVQLNELHNSFTYYLFILLLVVASFNAILVPTLGIVYTTFEMAPRSHHKRSIFSSIASLFPVIFSAVSLLLATVCLYFTARNTREWNSLSNASAFHLFGMRELAVSVYSLIVAAIGSAMTLTTSRRLRFSTAILYSVTLVLILEYLVNGERIFSTTENFRALEDSHLDSSLVPVTPALLMSLCILIWLMAVSYVVNLIIAVHRTIVPKRMTMCSVADKRPPYLEFRHRTLT